jgi:MFS transporter, DHA2 family, methylenomycin A resistance protein
MAVLAPIPAPVAARRLVLVVLCAGMFLVLFDVTVVNVALPSIGAGLGAGVPALQWVVDGYAVAIASLLLAGGTVGDRIGHRAVVLTGFGLFGAASVACALAPGTGVLIAGRVLQGAGAALLLPGTLALLANAFPEPAAQARAVATWAAASSLALPAGPLLGGLLVAAAGWRAVFAVNVPVVALAVAGVLRLVPTTPGHPRPLDSPALVAVVVGLGSLVFGVIEIGRDGLGLPAVAAFTVAAAAVVATVLAERRATAPMLPPELLRRPALLGPNVVSFVMNLTVNGTLFVTALYLQDVRGRSAPVSGALVLPLAVPLVALAPVAGRLTARYGPKVPVTSGSAIAAVGAALLLAVPVSGSLSGLEIALGMLGCGAGLITAAAVAAAVRAVPPERSGLASGLNNTARQTGTALGVACYGAIAGSPAQAGRFVTHLHVLAVLGLALWVLAVAVGAATMGRGANGEPIRN